jgi:hypothetical protein
MTHVKAEIVSQPDAAAPCHRTRSVVLTRS